jgi:anti-anti-sigma regulatory factor
MLKITLQESENAVKVVLEGRITGPWVTELNRAWVETVPRIGSRRVEIDMRNVIYADAAGKQVLRTIFSQSGAKLVGSSLGIQDLAEEIVRN